MTLHSCATQANSGLTLRHPALQLLLLLALSLVVVALMPAEHAFASATSGGGMPYETWLGTLRNSITGPVAFTVAIVALVGTGSALIFQGGEMNTFLRSTIYFILVIALVISAQNIMQGLFGKGAVAAVRYPSHFAAAAVESAQRDLAHVRSSTRGG